ncbi:MULTISPECIES: DUF1517 domain-containing protein [Cyanophyceae]|uniref:DUF1517 domain-containing protein n=1 Tax=Cyanophyceae TaxID=3028117 RepID=UPI001684F0DF|nr:MULTISPECIES: DUF1517 domain-containing protein [Cyanophyceae]MBD1915222.1 DUF1517 domain-containing protein [Phormidium sp. FACHB-77]MBD2032501.1 DUF1517 domain-containing protein [Phormidium sp. FACHB-322]MBD2050968.1 DUF1517 domain-containing protein [Leptolyngbya sp. FACHB-60]
MVKQLFQRLKPFLKPLMAVVLAVVLVFGTADGAWAAAGGRMGGGSFRAPAPRMSPSPRSYAPGGGGGYYPGGGFGMPFLFPFIGIGGGFGGLFTLLIFISIANVVVRGLRGATSEDDYDAPVGGNNPPVAIAKLQVGLLAQARELQDDLNRLAATADTGSSQGLAKLLQETTLALLRHPDYWAYATSEDKQTRLLNAEQEFNRYTLSARSRFSAETLSNVNNQLTQAEPKALLTGDTDQAPGEYILATVVVATQGKLDLPDIYSSADLRQALSQIGAVSGENLLAVEVLWTPQQSGETLSGDELIAQYPDLKLI